MVNNDADPGLVLGAQPRGRLKVRVVAFWLVRIFRGEATRQYPPAAMSMLHWDTEDVLQVSRVFWVIKLLS